MARPSPDIAAAMQAGFAATDPQNPHIWSSAMWEAWEFGRFAGQTGRTLNGIEKRRGNIYETADGFTFRAHYSKQRGGGSFGFRRVQ